MVRATDQPPAHLVGRRIAKIASAAYAQRGYLARVGRGHAFDGYDWLALDQSSARVPQARWPRERVPQPQCRFHFNLIETAHQCVRAGLGVAVVPCFVCDREPDLERLTAPETSGEFGVWVLTHPDLRRSARIPAFMQQVGTMIATQEQSLLGVRST